MVSARMMGIHLAVLRGEIDRALKAGRALTPKQQAAAEFLHLWDSMRLQGRPKRKGRR